MGAGDWLSGDDICNLNLPRKREAALRAARINTIAQLVALDLETIRSIPGLTDYGISKLKESVRFWQEHMDPKRSMIVRKTNAERAALAATVQ